MTTLHPHQSHQELASATAPLGSETVTVAGCVTGNHTGNSSPTIPLVLPTLYCRCHTGPEEYHINAIYRCSFLNTDIFDGKHRTFVTVKPPTRPSTNIPTQ